MQRHGRVLATLGGAVGLAVLLAGCGHTAPGTPAAQAKSAVPTETSSLHSTLDAQAQAALVAYRAMWADFAAVADSGNYQQVQLGDHMAGKLLQVSSQNLFLSEQRGMIGKGEPILLRPEVMSEELTANPPVITIADCLDQRNFLIYYATTGKPVDSDPGGLQAATTQMTLIGAVWKGTTEYLGAVGSCTG